MKAATPQVCPSLLLHLLQTLNFCVAAIIFFCWVCACAINLDGQNLTYSSPSLEMVPSMFSSVCIKRHVSGASILLACKSTDSSNSIVCCNLLYNCTLNQIHSLLPMSHCDQACYFLGGKKFLLVITQKSIMRVDFLPGGVSSFQKNLWNRIKLK